MNKDENYKYFNWFNEHNQERNLTHVARTKSIVFDTILM